MDLGTWGEWFAGVFAGIGVMFAGLQIRDHRLSAEQAARSEQEANARSVVAAVVHKGRSPVAGLDVLVENSGSYPVFETQLFVQTEGTEVASARLGVIRPGTNETAHVALRPPLAPDSLQLSVRFRDTYESIWETSEGRLREISGE